ncbi:hypothetical protein [Agromyces sp. SYSU T00194]|uniref:hypothetical protein n=1 Tax=Agromyces chitinivorans TaxID=3158560 RepID=UPI003391F3B0
MPRPRLLHVPFEDLHGRNAVAGDRWEVTKAHENPPNFLLAKPWLAGPRELGVYARYQRTAGRTTTADKYIPFETQQQAFTYAHARARGFLHEAALIAVQLIGTLDQLRAALDPLDIHGARRGGA